MGKEERMDNGRGRGAGVVGSGTGGAKGAGGGGTGKGSGKRHVEAAKKGGDKRPFYIGIALLAVAGIAGLSYVSARTPAESIVQLDSTVAHIPNQGHVLGSDSARTEVVEYADFECPGCGSFATLTEPDVRARLVNTGIIRFRFVDFPLTMHRNTLNAHLAAWCAGEQGKFWEMHDIIFENQDRWNGEATKNPDRELAELARHVGVNIPQYQSCVSSRKYLGQIQANVDAGTRAMVASTPTLIIGNQKVTGAIPYDVFKRHVDDVLAQQPAKPSTKQPATKQASAKTKTK